MKLLLIPNSIEKISNDGLEDGIIIGIKELSVNYNVRVVKQEFDSLKYNKEIFICINKVIFNSDIDYLESTLRWIERSNIAGVLFYDLSVLSIVRRLNLKINLIWNQEHMVTNYNTCNYYSKMGCIGSYFANELTLDEMIGINEKVNIKSFVNIISRPVMSHSRRMLLTNYFKNIDKSKDKDTYEISEKVSGNKYFVREEKDGTSIIYGNIVNGIKPFFEIIKHNFSYGVIDSTYLNDIECNDAIILARKVLDSEIIDADAIKLSNDLFGCDTGFFYKKTIYKVK